MLTDDECYEMWHAGGELSDTIRLIYKTGYDDGQADKIAETLDDFEVIDGEQENK
jgi:hypothetical protein